ncbi:hypothetical protein AB1Y20_015834 [Prymnesium parvum]|uniref:Protein kinase domain-containing protein n=1 Tax=Prymnesium parvum TaxID=97485 RepID=A0AB34K437_PRYPA
MGPSLLQLCAVGKNMTISAIRRRVSPRHGKGGHWKAGDEGAPPGAMAPSPPSPQASGTQRAAAEEVAEYLDDFEQEAAEDGADDAGPALPVELEEVAAVPIVPDAQSLGATARTVDEESSHGAEAHEEAYADDFEELEDEPPSPVAPSAAGCRRCAEEQALSEVQRWSGGEGGEEKAEEKAEETLLESVGSDGGLLRRAGPPWQVIHWAELEVGALLAQGAMGAVHAARWNGQSVAAKTLHDTSANQLVATEQELLMHASLKHPCIVALHGANLEPPSCCIVMERCEYSLFDRLHRQSRDIDRRKMVQIASQVSEAMAFMHSHSPPLVHRDLKSQNVLLTTSEDAKLCDFGLVNIKVVSAGTPNYMAPELFLSKPYSTSVDVYAFGVLLNEMFAREVPWDGYKPLEIKDKVVEGGRPRIMTSTPSIATSLIRSSWDGDATKRPTFESVILSLQDLEDSLPLGIAGLGINATDDALDALLR